MVRTIPKKIFARQHEITADFLRVIDHHLDDILQGRATKMLEIRDIARLLFIHPKHLTNTIKQTTGQHPSFFYEEKIMKMARRLLLDKSLSIAAIAQKLTYDPSNFSKFFKHFEGITPKQYREYLFVESPFIFE